MYYLRLLGGIFLEGPSGPLSGRVTQQRHLALLALLATSRTAFESRDKLIGLLWPDMDEQHGRHRLSDCLYVLRAALGEGAVIATFSGLSLNRDLVWTDVASIEAAAARGDHREAVGLFRGPFLEGFHLRHAPCLEQWIEVERRRYSALYAMALEQLARQAEDESDAPQALEWWRMLASHDPYCSGIALSLMRALLAVGDRAGALQHAREHARLLERDIGVEPSDELLALAAQLGRERAV